MKNFCLKLLFTILFTIFSMPQCHALQFDILVLPTDIFNVCDNYFCFPEASEIAANYVIKNLSNEKYINMSDLETVRQKLNSNPQLKIAVQNMLENYNQSEKIDFEILDEVSKEFGVKSIILITAYTKTDKNSLKRNLWETLEIANAFRTTYPYKLVTSAVLTDTVNNVIMWSSKYQKTLTDNNDEFLASNQAQATSQLEKIKDYYKENISKTISQNVYLRFFPSDVRTFNVKKEVQVDEKPKFVPNALEHLITPQMIKELDDGASNTYDSVEDFIFTF